MIFHQTNDKCFMFSFLSDSGTGMQPETVSDEN